MRRFSIATISLSATIAFAASGCRQTAPTAATGALTPLAPTTGSAAPSFQPFGGQTRVTPPPTGSYSVPNNYLGGSPPIGQLRGNAAVGGIATNGNFPGASVAAGGATLNPVNTPAGGFGSPSPIGAQPVGSGVRQTGWTETGANVPSTERAPAGGNLSPLPSGMAPARFAPAPQVTPARDPRAGGMQVIDLTSAPAPPGYRTDQFPLQQMPLQQPTAAQQPIAAQQPPPYQPYPVSQAASGMPGYAEATPAITPIANGAGTQPVTPVQYNALASTTDLAPIRPAGPSNNPASLAQVPTFQARQPQSSELAPVTTPPNLQPMSATSVEQSSSLAWRRPGAY